ncbi:MAG: hypothetical protein A2297_01145 [Elusimicrobia bacterium RIFOXYB2_FULL_48_7]|nr:MAG: hypothetical protein A2297_01145 [Elusimicrobia bacterium RIFOXYB2_FULL_48_7]
MPARNSQNPTRKENIFDTKINKVEERASKASVTGIAGVCGSCGTEIPSKPGFRPSSLKCPKCGKNLAK